MEVFIPYNTPSSKNSKIKGKFFSKSVQKYLRKHGIQSFSSSRKEVKTYKTIPLTFPVEELKELFKDVEYPVRVGFYFVRDSKRQFDGINICQILFDIFTAFDIIPDDNMDYTIPYFMKKEGKYYHVDKENAGAYIKVLKA